MKHTLRQRKISGRNDEQGIVVMLVAVFMLFVVGAMAALSIDVVTLYTARSEAQLAADAAALAAARVLANSGMTSDTSASTDGLLTSAETLASNVATQVAARNDVGGRRLNANNGEVTVTFNNAAPTNPHVTVTVQRTDLPTFFARMWGWTQIAVAASATAEAYNPSSAIPFGGPATIPVAPTCVKPWLLPNEDPIYPGSTTAEIFDPDSGNIKDPSLLGWSSSSLPMSMATKSTPTAWQFYPGDPPRSFPAPTQALPACAAAFTTYQQSVAGCVPLPISCSSTAYVLSSFSSTANLDTADAVNCLTNATNGGGDTLTTTNPPTAPFQFVAGASNPIAVANPSLAGQDLMVSDSLVTVPVFDSKSSPSVSPGSQVAIIGFVQLFLNPTGAALPSNTDTVSATVVNLAGCGRNAFGMGSQTPILGNGASPVAVRLITPP
ncbi:MAG: pilus assembly protein TadG-related protein [Terriglobales bacterium]|jgi:hypothetical protein